MDGCSTYGGRNVYGVAEIVVAGHNVVAVDVLCERQKPTHLQDRFGEKMVFLRNKNLQSFPLGLEGGIAYLPEEQAIVIVIRAQGSRALVRQLYPKMRGKAGLYVTSTFQHGWFLQQLAGKAMVEFNPRLRSRQIDQEGVIVPLTDDEGYIKCDWQGPDIGIVRENDRQANRKADEYVGEGNWTWSSPVARCTQQELPVQRDRVWTLYVYAKDVGDLKTILFDEKTGRSLVSVPVGPKTYDKRYETLLF
jgi:hypothetical protein